MSPAVACPRPAPETIFPAPAADRALVQIGHVLEAIRGTLDPWLGPPRRTTKERRVVPHASIDGQGLVDDLALERVF